LETSVTLSERLEQARRERQAAARGEVLAAPVPPPRPYSPAAAPAAPAPADADVLDLPVIEVRPIPGLRSTVDPSAAPAPRYPARSDAEGAEYDLDPAATRTSNCPTCGRAGHVDMADLVGHTTHFTCLTCGTMWQEAAPADKAAHAESTD
jgi:hypothetical protein